MSEIFVKIQSVKNEYPIYIQSMPLDDFFESIFSKINGKNFLVVISEKVDKLYGKFLHIDKLNKFILKDGEKQKNFKTYKKIIDKALSLKLSRQDTIIAVGGGVTGDLAGFVASTYMRGVHFIQVPTTLLACTDSSVGGKTAIDTKYGKNLVGTFYQPDAVYINPKFLQTLDEKQYKSGLGEVIKYSFIEKSCPEELDLTNFLNEDFNNIMKRDEKTLSKLIGICVRLKKSVVESDEKEANLRRILNFGHTYGHAVEKIGGYSKYTHGESVIEGIKVAFNIACQKGLIDKNYKFFTEDIIKRFGYKSLPKFSLKKVLDVMISDKKAYHDCLTFVLPVDYSKVECFDFTLSEIAEFFKN